MKKKKEVVKEKVVVKMAEHKNRDCLFCKAGIPKRLLPFIMIDLSSGETLLFDPPDSLKRQLIDEGRKKFTPGDMVILEIKKDSRGVFEVKRNKKQRRAV